MTLQEQASKFIAETNRAILMDSVNVLILRDRRNACEDAGNTLKQQQANQEQKDICKKAEARGYHSQFVAGMKAIKALYTPDQYLEFLGSLSA